MGFFTRLMGRPNTHAPAVQASAGETAIFRDLTDAAIADFLRDGNLASTSGIHVSNAEALKNPTVFRCVDLICGSIAMLPLNIHREDEHGDTVKVKDNPVQRLLRRRPNDWQTPFEFKGLMQYRALTEDNGAIALIVRSGGRPVALLPLNPSRVEMKLTEDFQAVYTYQRETGGRVVLRNDEVFHLRGLILDGVHGISRVKRAAEAIGISIAAERAVANMFRTGVFATGAVKVPNEMSPEAFERLAAQWRERHEGHGNAGSTPILEGGAEYVPLAINARDAQSAEARKFQVEEILRAFGVPRPLAMVDDTSWGTGVEQLSTGFVRYTLNPWFVAWQEAIGKALLDDDGDLQAKFNPGALLNGTAKDQAEAFAKASGAGGHQPWMTSNEIRGLLNLPRHPDGDVLSPASALAAPSQDTQADAAADQVLKGRETKNNDDT